MHELRRRYGHGTVRGGLQRLCVGTYPLEITSGVQELPTQVFYTIYGCSAVSSSESGCPVQKNAHYKDPISMYARERYLGRETHAPSTFLVWNENYLHPASSIKSWIAIAILSVAGPSIQSGCLGSPSNFL